MGLIFVGSAHEDSASAILDTLFEREDFEKNHTLTRFYSVALALLFMGQQEESENTIEMIESMIEHPIGKYTSALVEACAYVGTGNVLKIQKMLQYCVEKIEKPKKEEEDKEDEENEDEKKEEKKDDPNDKYKD